MYSLALPKANWGEEMKVCCPNCSQVVVIDDAAVKKYGATLMGKVKSEAKTAAVRENAKKPRPGSLGNTRAKKKEISP